MADAATRRRLLKSFAEGLRVSGRGPAIDLALFRELASLDLARVAAPVRVWIGSRDTNVPIAAARRLAERLPNGALCVLPGEGHLWVAQHYEEVLAWVEAITRDAGATTP